MLTPATLVALQSTCWYWTELSTGGGVFPTAVVHTVAYCIPCEEGLGNSLSASSEPSDWIPGELRPLSDVILPFFSTVKGCTLLAVTEGDLGS